jgi:hypothetical protein
MKTIFYSKTMACIYPTARYYSPKRAVFICIIRFIIKPHSKELVLGTSCDVRYVRLCRLSIVYYVYGCSSVFLALCVSKHYRFLVDGAP